MGYEHNHGTGLNERRLFWAALLTGVTMVAEAVGGFLSGSLALLADAGHMLTDTAALVFAWFAVRIATRPADWKRTYGFDRFQVLAAFTNGLALFFISIAIFYEAVMRLFEPVKVMGGIMFVIATAGLVVNIATLTLLRTGGKGNLNVRAALLHVLSDLLGSVAAIVAALVILWTGWMPIDPLLSMLITLLILRSAWLITKDAAHILLEAAPEDVDIREIQEDLVANISEVESIHHVHAWSLTEDRRLMTLHARISQTSPPEQVAAAIKSRLKQCYGIVHATVEVEHGSCADAEVPEASRKV